MRNTFQERTKKEANKAPAFGLVLAACLGMTACQPPATVPAGNVIVVTADVNAPAVWTSGHVYLIRAWDFAVNDTLTIQAGTVVKFHPADGPDLTLGGTGRILAYGTAADPIVFTSYRDDDNGGDTNGDGALTAPAAGDWGTIDTNGLSGSVFDNCEFYYGGDSTYTTTLSLSAGSSATVTDCRFVHNRGDYAPGWSAALDAGGAGAGTIIQNNVFYGNVRPLVISASFSLDDSNVFHNPLDPSEKNVCNSIFVYASGEISTAISWLENDDDVAFVIDDNDLWIESTGSLTLADGTVVKFRPDGTLVLDMGTASLVNYNGSGVAFTSYYDDSRKGDTNGDGNTTTPADFDWNGIYNDVTGLYCTWPNLFYDSH